MYKLRYILTFVTLLSLSSRSLAQEAEVKQFYDDITSSWTNRNYSKMLEHIDERLGNNTNDVFALSVKANYYCVADVDIAKAHQAAIAFTNAVHNSNRYELREESVRVVESILDIPLSESHTRTAADMDRLHSGFHDEFPGMISCIAFAGHYYFSFELHVQSLNPSAGVDIQASLDQKRQSVGATPFTRVYIKSRDLVLIAPETASGNVFKEWQKDGKVYTTGSELSFTFQTNTTVTAVYKNP